MANTDERRNGLHVEVRLTGRDNFFWAGVKLRNIKFQGIGRLNYGDLKSKLKINYVIYSKKLLLCPVLVKIIMIRLRLLW